MTDIREVRELHELNVQLLENLIVIGQRFIQYAEKYDIPVEGRHSLASLIARAQSIMEEIATPYRKNPVISDASYQQRENRSSDDKSTEPNQVTLKSNSH